MVVVFRRLSAAREGQSHPGRHPFRDPLATPSNRLAIPWVKDSPHATMGASRDVSAGCSSASYPGSRIPKRNILVYSAAMFREKIRRAIAFLCAVILMSGQFAVAAYACPQMLPSAAPNAAEVANMPPDCAREMANKPSPLCNAHCDPSAQSDRVPAAHLLPFAWMRLWAVSHLDPVDGPSSRALHNGPMWLTDASPPLRIQYQVFRI